MHEFLPLIVGPELVNDALRRGRRFYTPRPGAAFAPVESQAAAYRMGHSMVRPSYRANLAGADGQPFFAFIFDPAQQGKADPEDLRRGCRAARRFVGWQTFFDFGDGEVRPHKRIDTKISTPLFPCPWGRSPATTRRRRCHSATCSATSPGSLRPANDIARAIGVPPLTPSQPSEPTSLGVGFEFSTPRWYHLLKEAELLADGLHLGPVGGRVVAGVLLGLLQTDPGAHLSAQPNWRPNLPSASGSFRMTDLFAFAQVDPRSRVQ